MHHFRKVEKAMMPCCEHCLKNVCMWFNGELCLDALDIFILQNSQGVQRKE